jgi:hypothetical protein
VESSVLDVYRLPIGVRSIHFNSTSVLINGKSLYIRGVGRHEDADVSNLTCKILQKNLLNLQQRTKYVMNQIREEYLSYILFYFSCAISIV